MDQPAPLSGQEPEQWLRRIGMERDRAAFARLFDHFAPRLKAYLKRLGVGEARAEEVVQDTMLRVWQQARHFDPRRASAATWIFTIARNRQIDLLRHEHYPEIDPRDPALTPATPTPEAVLDRTTLARAIASLPSEQAQLVRLAYYEDHSHRTIAATTRLPLGTVKSRLHLALEKLRHILNPEQD